ncbi:MAG: hypothetical protein HUU46_13450 [Candidatus Hydrogenedentes bacterium]|nr:hypothetical protein [Candidatus Hydrogenedentota bacterium]
MRDRRVSRTGLQSKIQNPEFKTLRLLLVLFTSVAPLSFNALAEPLHDRILRANGLLRSGEVDKALDAYHQIQVDHPDSPVVQYNIGCAEYEKGVRALNSDEAKNEPGAMSEAIASFDRAIQGGDSTVATRAAFNRANSLAEIAKASGEGAAAADRAKSFQEAIRAYEDVLKSDPDNAGAKQNIDHLRYMLKKTPPPTPPQQGGDDSPQQDDQSGESQDQQQQQQNDSSEEPGGQQPESQPQQQDREQQDEESESSPDRTEQPKDQQNTGDNQREESGASEEEMSQPPQDGESPTPDQQSVEALLQSLENLDKEMQKDLRKGSRTARVRSSGWW